MKKLVLSLDELRVTTFELDEARAPRGTVAGHYASAAACYSRTNCQGGCPNTTRWGDPALL